LKFADSLQESFFKSKKKDPSTEHEHMSHQYRDWRDFLTRCLDDYMPRNELYHLLHTSSLVGLFTCIFVKASLRERIHNICGAEVKRGMGGLHGNKVSSFVQSSDIVLTVNRERSSSDLFWMILPSASSIAIWLPVRVKLRTGTPTSP
jgi:hypothetical protein